MNDYTELPENEEPDLGGWDRERDGFMAEFQHIEVGAKIEPYNPEKDPVNKGLVPSPYEDE